MLIAAFDFFANCSVLGAYEQPSMLNKMAQDLFNLVIAGLILWGFGWMCWHCCQSKPKPRNESYNKRRRRNS